MIQCMTYDEVRMTIVEEFAKRDCDLKGVYVLFDEQQKCFWVGRETIDFENEEFWFEFNGWEERKKK